MSETKTRVNDCPQFKCSLEHFDLFKLLNERKRNNVEDNNDRPLIKEGWDDILKVGIYSESECRSKAKSVTLSGREVGSHEDDITVLFKDGSMDITVPSTSPLFNDVRYITAGGDVEYVSQEREKKWNIKELTYGEPENSYTEEAVGYFTWYHKFRACITDRDARKRFLLKEPYLKVDGQA
jgi:hypothetical protein